MSLNEHESTGPEGFKPSFLNRKLVRIDGAFPALTARHLFSVAADDAIISHSSFTPMTGRMNIINIGCVTCRKPVALTAAGEVINICPFA